MYYFLIYIRFCEKESTLVGFWLNNTGAAAMIYLDFFLQFFHTPLNLTATECLLLQLFLCLFPLAAYPSNLHPQSSNTPKHSRMTGKQTGKLKCSSRD